MALDLHQCDKACLSCIKHYKCKHSLVAGQQFKIKCKGIPKYQQLEMFTGMAPDQQEAAVGILDPVQWAAETLDWHCLDPDGSIWKRKNPEEYAEWVADHPGESIMGQSRYHRPYQAEMLRCSARRKVFRIGRQAGKCLVSGTQIQMADGTLRSIESILPGEEIVGLNDSYRLVAAPAILSPNGLKPVFKLFLMDGRSIEGSGNHPFLIRSSLGRQSDKTVHYIDEWKDLQEIGPNDYVAVPRNLDCITGNEWLSNARTIVLAFLLSDGNVTSENCRFSNTSPQIIAKMNEALNDFQCSLKHYPSDAQCDYHIVDTSGKRKSHQVRSWLRQLGLWGLGSHDKMIPNSVMSLSNQTISSLLKYMFACDGWASVSTKTQKPEIGYSTVSETMALQIVSLLARFGIYADLRIKKSTCNGKTFYSRQIIIAQQESIKNFCQKIGIFSKETQVADVLQVSQAKQVSNKIQTYQDEDVIFIKVKDVIPVGNKMTWDLTVPGIKNFIANGIISHNTEAIVVSMLYHLFTKPGLAPEDGFHIVVLTPYQAQIDIIFKRMMELLRSSSTTSNSISRHVKAPIYTITLYNQSEVKGFTAGTKSGGNADAIRGQHANMLVFDEADYLSPKDMESALSIIINYPNASVWMSSTPSGKREKFFDTCNSLQWREYYYTSKVNPMFNEQLDLMFKEQMSQIAYKHEVLADFGEQEEGVFQNVYVQAAKFDYKYGDIPRNANWVYTMGVDWNDTKIGTTIVVLGFDPSRNMFFIVDRHIVSRDGWTQLSACQKIAELNRLWRPLVIYTDAGFGGTQWEVLRKYGFDSAVDPSKGPMHPDARLRDIVKRYDFGSKVEVHDLWTKAPIDKPAKPFLVESTTRRFETQDIKFSKYDEHLEKQLLGYVIDRVTPTGIPVYKASDPVTGDHTLDALMLSVIGFVLEATPLGKPRYATNISFTGYFGEHTMPEVHEGDTVIQVPKKEGEERKRLRPEMARTAAMQPTSLLGVSKEIPGSHIQGPKQLGLWDYAGWSTDAPRPKVRSLSEAESDARKRTGYFTPRRNNRPCRKNI